MKRGALTWCITLSAILCIILTGGWASAQNAQGLSAVGALDPANGYPRWYMDRTGLQLGQCLDTTSPADPCVMGVVAGSPAPPAIPNPGAPLSFPDNFPDEFFYWRTTADIANIGGVGGRAVLVMSTQAGFGGATGTAADGAGAQIVFARYRVRVRPNGLVPGATYTVTGPFGVQSFVASATGTINFTIDEGCPLGAPLPCDFTSVLPTSNAGPFLTWDPAIAPLPTAGFIGDGLIAHTIIGSPFHTNIFRIQGPNVGGPGVNVVETNEFVNVIGKIYVRPATSTVLNSTPNPSVFGQAVTLTATVTPVRPDTIAPTGTVVFKDGATTLGVVTLVNGSASLVTSALAAGAHSLTASYSGDLEFSASTSAVRIQTVNPGQTTTTLTSTPNPSLAGQAVTLSTTVTAVAPAVGIPTGTVTFRDGATPIGTVTLVNGSASLVTSTLTTGNHSLTAVYNGSQNFLTSTSPAVTQVVNSQTTTSLTAPPNPSVIGQAVTLTAVVSPVAPGTGVPTGTVTFRDGATVLATVTLVNGSASFVTSTLAVGSHSLTAAYSGGGNFLASTSAVVAHTVNPGSTSTSLTSTPNPSTLGQTVTLSATVSAVAPAVGIPTGTVTFRDGATSLGVVTLVNGSASLTVSTLTTGSHSLTAVYSGSPNFNASTSPAVTQVVNPGNTTTSLTSTPNPSNFGQTVTLSATVNPVAPATGVPTGTVTFRDGATALATVNLVNGSASFSLATLTPGSHSLTAVYNGSASFAGSTSAVVNHVVNAGNSSTSLTSAPNPSTTGQTVALTATVSAVAPATGTPTGTVTFRDSATVLSTVTLVNGSASFQTAALAVGSHPLTATYNGSATFAVSTSAVVTQLVNAPAAAATSTSLTSTPNPSTTGQAVTLTATVTSAAGVPTGTVTFRDGATALGTVTLVNGSASFVTSTLAAGSHPLTAAYNGSATFAASTSAVVTQVVNAPNNNAADTVTINRAEFRAGRGELRVEGTNSQIPGGGFAASVEIHNGAAAGNTCPGALIATTGVSATGTWQFRGNTTLTVTTVCVKSAGGGVASRTVTQK